MHTSWLINRSLSRLVHREVKSLADPKSRRKPSHRLHSISLLYANISRHLTMLNRRELRRSIEDGQTHSSLRNTRGLPLALHRPRSLNNSPWLALGRQSSAKPAIDHLFKPRPFYRLVTRRIKPRGNNKVFSLTTFRVSRTKRTIIQHSYNLPFHFPIINHSFLH